jgi:hypothetical protein
VVELALEVTSTWLALTEALAVAVAGGQQVLGPPEEMEHSFRGTRVPRVTAPVTQTIAMVAVGVEH